MSFLRKHEKQSLPGWFEVTKRQGYNLENKVESKVASEHGDSTATRQTRHIQLLTILASRYEDMMTKE